MVDLDLSRHRRDDLVHLGDGVLQAQGDAGSRYAALVKVQPSKEILTVDLKKHFLTPSRSMLVSKICKYWDKK